MKTKPRGRPKQDSLVQKLKDARSTYQATIPHRLKAYGGSLSNYFEDDFELRNVSTDYNSKKARRTIAEYSGFDTTIDASRFQRINAVHTLGKDRRGKLRSEEVQRIKSDIKLLNHAIISTEYKAQGDDNCNTLPSGRDLAQLAYISSVNGRNIWQNALAHEEKASEFLDSIALIGDWARKGKILEKEDIAMLVKAMPDLKICKSELDSEIAECLRERIDDLGLLLSTPSTRRLLSTPFKFLLTLVIGIGGNTESGFNKTVKEVIEHYKSIDKDLWNLLRISLLLSEICKRGTLPTVSEKRILKKAYDLQNSVDLHEKISRDLHGKESCDLDDLWMNSHDGKRDQLLNPIKAALMLLSEN